MANTAPPVRKKRPPPPPPPPSSSSSSLQQPHKKKTRDLPNLTDCHSCRLRIINPTNTKKEKFPTLLYSEWRIVLLCKQCLKNVESSKICSYCFSESSSIDSHRCPKCKRLVHKDCASKFKDLAPSSYSGSIFSVCIDCWVPKLMRNGDAVRVLKDNSSKKSLEDVVKYASSSVEKKVLEAAGAREKALRKAVAVKRAAELDANALKYLAKRDDDLGDKSAVASEKCSNRVVDDAELAFQLHRAMNSSPRISKNSVNSIPLASCPKTLLCYSRSSSRKRKLDNSDNAGTKQEATTNLSNLFENGDVKASKRLVSSVNLDNLDVGFRTSSKNEECREKDENSCKCDAKDVIEPLLKEGEGSCSNKLNTSSGDENSIDYDSRCYQGGDDLGNELRPNRTVVCNERPGRYAITYSKRTSKLKSTKIVYGALCIESEASAPDITLNCSEASRTLSDASFQSRTVPLQASVCPSGGCRHDS